MSWRRDTRWRSLNSVKQKQFWPEDRTMRPSRRYHRGGKAIGLLALGFWALLAEGESAAASTSMSLGNFGNQRTAKCRSMQDSEGPAASRSLTSQPAAACSQLNKLQVSMPRCPGAGHRARCTCKTCGQQQSMSYGSYRRAETGRKAACLATADVVLTCISGTPHDADVLHVCTALVKFCGVNSAMRPQIWQPACMCSEVHSLSHACSILTPFSQASNRSTASSLQHGVADSTQPSEPPRSVAWILGLTTVDFPGSLNLSCTQQPRKN